MEVGVREDFFLFIFIMIKKPLTTYGLGTTTLNRFLRCIGLNSTSNEIVYDLLYKRHIKNLNKNRSLKYGFRLKSSNRLRLAFLELVCNYKTIRRMSGLPVRGQRTHTNARIAKKLNYK